MIQRSGKPVLIMVVTLLLLACLSLPLMGETPERVSLSIPNMVCMSCEMQIERAVTAVEGVTQVDFDGEAQLAMISFDPARATLEAILEASEGAGYPATVITDTSGQ